MPLVTEYCMVMCENDTSLFCIFLPLLRPFYIFITKKTTKCDRLNVFIITFATLINNERNREYEQVLSTYSHIHVHDHDP